MDDCQSDSAEYLDPEAVRHYQSRLRELRVEIPASRSRASWQHQRSLERERETAMRALRRHECSQR